MPTRVALNFNSPSLLIDPATTCSPAFLSTGNGSPLSIDSSTADFPSITIPSTGIFSPGRIITVSSFFTRLKGTSFSTPFSMIVAVFGCRPISLRIAPPVLPLVRDSSILPSLMRVMITADVSK